MAAKHIFLTGNIQIGKSTILRAIIKENEDAKLGGLFTRWINKGSISSAGLYLFPADRDLYETVHSACCDDSINEGNALSDLLTEEKLIATFEKGNYKKKIINKKTFEQTGRQYLQDAADADLILIDEVGILEDRAYGYHEELLKLLDGDTPVIGVVRNKQGHLTNAVKEHPNVEIVEITRENRNTIKEELVQRVKELIRS